MRFDDLWRNPYEPLCPPPERHRPRHRQPPRPTRVVRNAAAAIWARRLPIGAAAGLLATAALAYGAVISVRGPNSTASQVAIPNAPAEQPSTSAPTRLPSAPPTVGRTVHLPLKAGPIARRTDASRSAPEVRPCPKPAPPRPPAPAAPAAPAPTSTTTSPEPLDSWLLP